MGLVKWIVAQPLAGGMPLGFEEAFGCLPTAIISAGFPNDDHYINYVNNIQNKKIPIIHMEADYLTFKSEDDEILYNKLTTNVDVLMHVAVCSGLSAMNASSTGTKARGCPDNEQNQNMYNLTNLGMRMDAKVVAFENAPAAYTKAGEGTINRLKDFADDFNYSTQLIKTDTLLHGVPQARQRTFIMFYKDTTPPIFEYEHLEYTKLPQYLKEIPKDSLHQDLEIGDINTELYKFVLFHTKKDNFLDAIESLPIKPKTVTAFMATEAIGFSIAMEYFKDKNERAYNIVKNAKFKKDSGKNYWDSTPYIPFRGDHTNAVVGKHIHLCINPNEERALNVREMMHLMGLPHDFELLEPKKNWNHIAQNVPLKTAKYVGTEIKKHLEGKLLISGIPFLKQNNVKQRVDSDLKIELEKW